MELFRLLGTISIDANEANRAIDETTNNAQNSEKKQSGAFKKIGKAAGTLAKGVAGAGAVLGGAFIAATEGTREYRQSMGQLETAFTTSGHSAEAAKSTYSDLNSVLGDGGQATEAAQQLAMLTDNQKDLDTMTHALTGVYARFGEALPVEGLAEAANHTAKVGEVQGNLADALEWSGVSVDDFNAELAKCSTEQERTALITSTLNDLYGDAATKYKEVNKDVIEAEKAQARLTDVMGRVGGVLEPLMTSMKNGFASALEWILPFVETFVSKIPAGVDGMKTKFNAFFPYLQAAWSTLWMVLQTVWQTVGQPVFEFIKQIAGQLIAFFQANFPKIQAVVRDVFTIIQNLWNSVLKPVLTILGNYIKNTLLPIWKSAFNGIMKVVQTVFNGIIKLWNGSLKPILNGIISFVSGVLTGNWSKAWNGIKSIISGVFSGIKTVISTAISTIKSVFSAGLGVVKTTVSTIFNNIKNTITDKMDAVRKKIKDVIDKIKGWFNTTLKFKGLKMPSISLTMKKGSGLMAKAAEVLGLDGVPSFSVKWNAEGVVFKKPAIFNTPFGLQGVSESGAEAIAPISTLQSYIDKAVNSRNEDIIRAFEMQISRLISFVQAYFPAEYKIMLDTGILAGQLAPEMDSRLADIYRYNKRNTR